jgi:hypothetical protein
MVSLEEPETIDSSRDCSESVSGNPKYQDLSARHLDVLFPVVVFFQFGGNFTCSNEAISTGSPQFMKGV